MKRTITQLSSNIDNYSALSAPLSIDPVLDGGIKKDILETLNNKASNVEVSKLSIQPSSDIPTSGIGSEGDYYLVSTAPALLFKKISGSWNSIDKSNDMSFYNDGSDGVRRYYAFTDDLSGVVLVDSLNFGDPSGSAVQYTPQTLTAQQKIQARINIDAASQAYIDNSITALKMSGAIGSSVAGSVMPWFGPDSVIPQDWGKIGDAATWYSKTDYHQLYLALGGEANPYGITSTTFSTPWFPAGTSIVKNGTGFVMGTNGGTKEETLTIEKLPAHSFFTVAAVGRGAADTLVHSPTGSVIATEATGNVQDDDNNAYKLYSAPAGSVASIGKTNTVGGGLAHNNMPPYAPACWIIKLKNTGGSFTAHVNGDGDLILTFDDGTTQNAGSVCSANPTYILSVTEASSSVFIPIPAETWVRDINVFVTAGTPTVNIPAIASGDMTGQELYPNSAGLHFSSAGNLQVNISGTGTVKIQIIKYNI